LSLLITLEGLDGTGKSTLASDLSAALKADPLFTDEILLTKEPGSKFVPNGQDLRRLALETPDFRPFERELLFYVDASMHTNFINSQSDALFVSDRGLWSHLAYLRGYLKTRQIDYDTYSLCKQVIARVCAVPDCVIYFEGDLELMKERLAGKSKDVIENNGEEFYNYVLETYQDLRTNREWDGRPILVLDPRLPTSANTMNVVNYLKEVFHENQLRNGCL
jgi:thymidylate kinase